MGRPRKRAKLLSDEESVSDGNVQIQTEPGPRKATNGFKVNEAYARRFEHNKKREEKDRLEEKYGKKSQPNGRAVNGAEEEEDEEESSSDESEDDDAELATQDVDEEIMATLNAIRSKDPKVYDKEVKFYREFDPASGEMKTKQEKPMYLQDYHRRNLLEGKANGEDEEMEDAPPPRTYQQEQDDMKRQLVGSMHATAEGVDEADESDEDEEGGFLVKKEKSKHEDMPTAAKRQITDTDVAEADKDPETYLSNFMAARAWLPTESSQWQAFDSDDSEEEKRADQFEEAYNMRFEDPKTANEKLQSFARDAGKYSVRRDDNKSSRQRTREREREKKDAAKREREEEKARLRKLKIEEAEEKVKRIKEAAGLSKGDKLDFDEWKDVIEGDFDDERWEQEMERRFGDKYYAAQEDGEMEAGSDEDAAGKRKRKALHKPTWNDDIDIKDLVPEFEDEEGKKPEFTLSDDEDEEDGGVPVQPDDVEEPDESQPKSKPKSKKDRAKDKADAKHNARRERRLIENLVDANLPVTAAGTAANPTGSSAHPARDNAGVPGFRYRETSPTTFGLSARDILFADDAQLNQYAGLKKLTAWREDDKKKRDRKRFSKKQRLREWRRETFGDVEGPRLPVGTKEVGEDVEGKGEGEKKGKKRKRRGKGMGEVKA
ncbi:Kinetochore protein Spc24 [Saxophila tyrrhenica]|uniref:Kinetochore protein Spc24 n=1 Tax=Saxophila tyrrhenica TaxID=1690608 RepID=A0AAV9PNS4_9PEZI|nr:Kinetochore protein Spc24 [Saxophila tyrrhenica]